MIHPNSDAFTFEARARLGELVGWLARMFEGIASWAGFLLLCLFTGGRELRRHGRERSSQVEIDG